MGSPGGSGLTYTEQRAHFALWAIIKSPLIIGADLRCTSHVANLLKKIMPFVCDSHQTYPSDCKKYTNASEYARLG